MSETYFIDLLRDQPAKLVVEKTHLHVTSHSEVRSLLVIAEKVDTEPLASSKIHSAF